MPKKKNPDATPSMKVLAAYWLLLFSGRAWTLTELAEKLECSKPTVMRIMDNIEFSGYAPLESGLDGRGRRWYRLMRPPKTPNVALSIEDIHTLLLCRDIAWKLLPGSLRKTVSTAIGHTTVLLPDFAQRKLLLDGIPCVRPNSGVDYTEKGEVLACLMQAMQENRVCELEYRPANADEPRIHRVAPRRLLPYKDSLYIIGWLLKNHNTVYKTTLAVHRIAKAGMTDEVYDRPWQDDTPAGFGIIKGDPFRVRASFTPSAACYVSERMWSEDQVLEAQSDGGVILTFTATSWPEVVAWALSFGNTITVLEPEGLRHELKEIAKDISAKYQDS